MEKTVRLLFVALAVTILLAAPARAQDWSDARQPTIRTPEQKAFVLGQMRLLVASLQAMDEGLAERDAAKVVAAARLCGLEAVRALAKPPGLAESETPEWKAWGMATRKGFDELAEAAEQGASVEKILGLRSVILKNCIACHEAFRIETPAPRLP
jgi:hypothetical protein